MATRLGSVDPSKFVDEAFELYSIPAFDGRKPEVVTGKEIGSTKQLVQPRDVLLSKIVPHIRRSWIVGASGQHRQIASGEWIVFRSDRALPEYLRHVLLSDDFHTQFMQTVSGVGGSLLRARPAQVAKIRIPLPSVSEQRRIAAILDKADALRAKRREALAQLDRLAQSIFVEMFGEPSTNPKRWPLVNLEEYLLDVTNGLTRRGTEVDRGLHIVLRLRDIRAGSIDFSEPNRITLNEKEQAKYLVTPGELLFIRVNGNPEYVGRCALFDGHHEHVFFNDHVMRVRLKSGLESGYLAFFLNRPEGKLEIAKHRKTSAGQHTINQNGLGALSLLLPPPELQQQFLNRLTQLRKSSASHRSSLTELDVLFHSVQHRAFRGTL